MKRLIVPFLAVGTLLYLGPSAYAQHGRPPGTPGSMGTHGSSASAAEGHDPSHSMASTDPGTVLKGSPNLTNKLETLTGTTNPTDLETDAKAFKNFGQFVAAAHVAKNLHIQGGFAALMCAMTTKGPAVNGQLSTCPNTNTTKMSLGKAIQTLDPQADSKAEAKKATTQARQDINESGS